MREVTCVAGSRISATRSARARCCTTRRTGLSSRAATTASPAATRTPTASAWAGTTKTATGGPGLYRNTLPAWGDRNLLDLAGHIRSPLFLGHVRAATGTPVEQSNCHPFRHGNWLFQHNGFIEQHLEHRRELLLAIDPSLFASIDGTTDSQLLFFLALTFGLEDDPIGALERMAGFVEGTGRSHGIAEPLQMTIAVSDGERLYAARYASGPVVNSLFVSEDARSVRALYPDDERFSISRTSRA